MSDHIPDATKMIGETPISDSTPHNVAELGMLCRKLERELTAAHERIKRMEEAGDVIKAFTPPSADRIAQWNQAKENKR